MLIEFGNTKVLCTASVEERVPPHKRGSGEGWVTAEYGMLPRATHTRSDREAARGKTAARKRSSASLAARCGRCFEAAGRAHHPARLRRDPGRWRHPHRRHHRRLGGAQDAVNTLIAAGKITQSPLREPVAAISVGIVQGTPLLDLEYVEDVDCDTDMNVVMTGAGHYVEVQGTAEGVAFTRKEMDQLLVLAEKALPS